MLRAIFLIIIIITSTSSQVGTKMEKVVFPKRTLGYRAIYYIERPNYSNIKATQMHFIGGHGHGFQFTYSNPEQTTIYYTNDRAILTPNNKNYETIGWKGFNIIFEGIDTILEGQQVDGLFWKEIKKGDDFLGYINVPSYEKHLFDQALTTFRKKN